MGMDTLKSAVGETLPGAIELLNRVVDINSFTSNREGTNHVGRIFRDKFEALGLSAGVIPRDAVGDILLFSNGAFREAGRGGVIFLSHMDTVFAPGGEIMPFRREDGRYTGNGCTDDKGGGVITWQALSALKAAGDLERIPIRVLLNTDEETGSDYSREVIERESALADLALVMEYGKPRENGATVVTSRLGRSHFDLALEGEKAETVMLGLVEKAFALCTPDGMRVVRVKEYEKERTRCRSRINFLYPTPGDGEAMRGDLQGIIDETLQKSGLRWDVYGGISRPPVIFDRGRQEMFDRLREIAGEIGFQIQPEHRASCSDGSFVPQSVKLLDGVGPIGDNVHTSEEFLAAESLTIRPLLTAALLKTLM